MYLMGNPNSSMSTNEASGKRWDRPVQAWMLACVVLAGL